MKRIIFLFWATFALALFSSCNNDEITSDLNKRINKSGSIDLSDFPKTVEINGKKIIFELSSDSIINANNLKAAGVWDGPFYSQGNMNQLYSDHKMMIYNLQDPPLGTGVFFCDVFVFRGQVYLPANAIVGKITLPNPCGYKDYNNQTLGINWSMGTDSKGTSLTFSFYTLRISHNALGQQLGIVIPLDGRTIRVPYYYMTE